MVHTLAHHMGLAHVSRGTGEHRQVHVVRAPQTGNDVSPPMAHYPIGLRPAGDAQRRGLNRAATIDFGEARASDPTGYGAFGRHPSSLLDLPGSPLLGGVGGGVSAAAQNLRGAKSFANLRSYTPSPVPSSASFPTAHNLGVPRYGDDGMMVGSSAIGGSLTSTAPGMPGSTSRDDLLLAGGLGGLSLGAGLGIGGGSAREPRSMLSAGDRESQPQSFGGPIGSNRTFSSSQDDVARERAQGGSLRQPLGPLPERGPGFPRNQRNGHRQRGSDESTSLPVQTVEIVVE